MGKFVLVFLQFGLPVFLLLLGLAAGKAAESKHFRSLERREKGFAHMLITDIKTFPRGADAAKGAMLVMGEAVIATDYLKSFLARLRNFFGGEIRSYKTLMERARREAMLRMLWQARAAGHNAVCNLRLNTVTIGTATRRRGGAMVEMLVTGTAYTIPSAPEP